LPVSNLTEALAYEGAWETESSSRGGV
jgi:hypothetical protein